MLNYCVTCFVMSCIWSSFYKGKANVAFCMAMVLIQNVLSLDILCDDFPSFLLLCHPQKNKWIQSLVWYTDIVHDRHSNTNNSDKFGGGICSGRIVIVVNLRRRDCTHLWRMQMKHEDRVWGLLIWFIGAQVARPQPQNDIEIRRHLLVGRPLV